MFRWWGVGTEAWPPLSCLPSVSSVPMVGCRNHRRRLVRMCRECIKCSDGGVSEQPAYHRAGHLRVYQVFRWWGVGTGCRPCSKSNRSVSSVPMVGCRNRSPPTRRSSTECIKCSDGGVSEPARNRDLAHRMSVSSVPMVGCRNTLHRWLRGTAECIKCSDGGVSERRGRCAARMGGVYQVFRWWGVGTPAWACSASFRSVSSVPMVGCRNRGLAVSSVR